MKQDEVRHIAKLAQLKLTEAEIKKFQKLLSDTIIYVRRLNELNTKMVVPTSQVTGLENVFREDRAEQSLSQNQALANAKETKNGYFKIKAIFKNE